MGLRLIGYKDGRWIGLVLLKWQVSVGVLVVTNFCFCQQRVTYVDLLILFPSHTSLLGKLTSGRLCRSSGS
jgi:hypothetical protein